MYSIYPSIFGGFSSLLIVDTKSNLPPLQSRLILLESIKTMILWIKNNFIILSLNRAYE